MLLARCIHFVWVPVTKSASVFLFLVFGFWITNDDANFVARLARPQKLPSVLLFVFMNVFVCIFVPEGTVFPVKGATEAI